MSRLQKVIFYPKSPVRRPTEEELKEFDKEWDLLCEGKSVCFTDPSKSGTPMKLLEDLKDPNCPDPLFIDWNDEIVHEEPYQQELSDEYDEK